MEKESKLLAINPGKRYLGIAIFVGTELKDWALKCVRDKNVLDLISEYMSRYQINVFAIKKFHPSRSSSNLCEIITSLKEYAKKHGGCLYEYSIEDIEKEFLPQKPRNKNLLVEEILIRYPFLYKFVEREKKNKSQYLMRMFEAIGIGASCLQQIDIEESKVRQNKK